MLYITLMLQGPDLLTAFVVKQYPIAYAILGGTLMNNNLWEESSLFKSITKGNLLSLE